MFRPAPFLVTLLHRVKAVVRRVARAAERVTPVPAHMAAAATAPISPVLRGLVQGWMSAKVRALSALTRRIEAGDAVDRPVVFSRRAHEPYALLERAPIPPEERLPRGFGWMCAFGPDVRRDGAAFAAWLNEPAMKAKVLAAPKKMAHLIGPILTATGERKPDWFPTSSKGVRTSSPPIGERCGPGADGTQPDGFSDPRFEVGGGIAPAPGDLKRIRSSATSRAVTVLPASPKGVGDSLGSRSPWTWTPPESVRKTGGVPQSSRPTPSPFLKMRPLDTAASHDCFITIS